MLTDYRVSIQIITNTDAVSGRTRRCGFTIQSGSPDLHPRVTLPGRVAGFLLLGVCAVFTSIADKSVEKAALSYFQKQVFQPLGITEDSAWVAGGSVRRFIEQRSVPRDCDIDLWSASEEVRISLENSAREKNWQLLFENETSSNWKTPFGKWLQIIRKHSFDSPEKTLEAFDFTVCAMAVSPSRVVMHENAMLDLAMRRLAVIALPFPLSSMKRALKYSGNGFKICSGELTKLIEAIQKASPVSQQDSPGRYPWVGLD